MKPEDARTRADLVGGFIRACWECGSTASGETLGSVASGLLMRWREPGRYYHDGEHLSEVLVAIEELRKAESPSDVAVAIAVLAAWYHDAIYQTSNPEANETASAELAARELARVRVHSEAIDAVTRAVLASAEHRVEPGDAPNPGASGRRIFLDADLWILSSPSERYAEFARDVRREYKHVPKAEFARARSGVLRALVDGGGPYTTEHARLAWTPAARRNVSIELAGLATLGLL